MSAINPVSNMLYVVNNTDGTVTVIDGATNMRFTTVQVGTFPTAIAVNPISNRIYVANQTSNDISVIDGVSNATTTLTPGHPRPNFVAVNQATNQIYALNIGDNTMTVIAEPPLPVSIVTQPASTSISVGQSTTLSVKVGGGNLFTYKWFQGASGDVSKPVRSLSSTVATSDSFPTPVLNVTTNYWVRVSNGSTSVNSNTATVAIPVSISTQPAGKLITTGQIATLSVSVSGGSSFNYTWYQGVSGDTSLPPVRTVISSGSTTDSFTTPALNTTTSYWVRVSNGTNSVDSSTATITVSTGLMTTPSSLTFTGSPSGTNPVPQTVSLTANTSVTWTTATSTSSGGNWLSATPVSGSTPGTVSVSASVAGLSPGTYSGTVAVTPSIGTVVTVSVTLTVTPAVAISLQPSALSFQAIVGGAVPPSQSVIINTSNGSAVNWSAQASTSSGGSWLSAAPTSGSAPGNVFVSVDPSSLVAGTYKGTITISTPLGNPTSQTVAVSLTVGAAQPALLSLDTSALTFSTIVNQIPDPQIVSIGNTGSGSLNWTSTFAVQTPAGGNWLLASPSSASSSASAPHPLTITLNTRGLPAGVYSGIVTVSNLTNPETSKPIAVTLIVSTINQTMVVSQTGLTFVGVQGGSSIPPQRFGVLNTGFAGSSMNWSASYSTQSGGAWLSVTPTSGVSVAASLTALPSIPLVQVSVNVSQLPAGQYYGSITVNAPGASNGTQLVTVVLQVLPAGSNPGPIVRPTGLIFVAPAGGAAPSPQTVQLQTALGEPVTATVSASTWDGGTWLSSLTPTVPAAVTGSFSADVSPASLTASSTPYRGVLILYFSDGSFQTVAVTFLVISASRAPSDGGTAACVPTGLLLTATSVGAGSYQIPTGYPTQVQAQVEDNCGNPLPSQANLQTALVVAAPQNGDAPFALNSILSGLYENSYNPSRPTKLNITATAAFSLIPAQTSLALGVQDNPGQPTLSAGGIVNAASYAGGPLAPGSIISIFGSNMATQSGGTTTIPLPQSLNGAKLFVAGNPTALFYSANGQVNAQLPFELPANGQAQILLSAPVGSQQVPTAPQTVVVGAAQPGIFTTNSSGTGQGVIFNNPANQLVNASAPASPGDIVTVYCTGLGLTNPPAPATGYPTPSGLFNVTALVTATVGGVSAPPVQFAGLTPGFVGSVPSQCSDSHGCYAWECCSHDDHAERRGQQYGNAGGALLAQLGFG